MPKSKNKLFLITLAVFIFLFLIVVSSIPPKAKKIAKPVLKGKIAIVIDDWGYNLNNLPIARQIKHPLTCAVLPNLKNSRLICSELHKLGFEIILHLPMQPKENFRLEKNTIAVSMSQQDIRKIISDNLKSLLFVKGVSNHMGSMVTENQATCAMIFKELSRRNLYFLDSFVTARSVAFGLAKNIGLKCAKRDVFLDNVNDPEYIRGQIMRLKFLAAKRGVAVGIGHDRKTTLKVLSQMIPQLVKEGYRFVYLSEIVQ